jgi:hypothetical protein
VGFFIPKERRTFEQGARHGHLDQRLAVAREPAGERDSAFLQKVGSGTGTGAGGGGGVPLKTMSLMSQRFAMGNSVLLGRAG